MFLGTIVGLFILIAFLHYKGYHVLFTLIQNSARDHLIQTSNLIFISFTLLSLKCWTFCIWYHVIWETRNFVFHNWKPVPDPSSQVSIVKRQFVVYYEVKHIQGFYESRNQGFHHLFTPSNSKLSAIILQSFHCWCLTELLFSGTVRLISCLGRKGRKMIWKDMEFNEES